MQHFPPEQKAHQQPPQYQPDHQQQMGISDSPMIIIPPETDLIDREYKAWSWCPMVTAIISLFCCCCAFPCTLLANIFATFGWMEHRTKQYSRAYYLGKAAKGFGITAIVIGSAVLVIYIIGIILAMAQLHKIQNRSLP